MDAARRVVLVDCGLGAALTLNWLFLSSRGGAPRAWWVAAVGLACMAGGAYADEHLVTDWPETRRVAAAVVGVLALVGLWGVIAVASTVRAAVAAHTLAGGLGIGLFTYRLVFGVVLPVPAKRLEGASERAV